MAGLARRPVALLLSARLVGSSGGSGLLGGLFVLAIHGYALAGEDVGEGAFVAELAVALDEPGAGLLLGPGLGGAVGEGAGAAGGAGPDLEELAGHMGEVLGWGGQ